MEKCWTNPHKFCDFPVYGFTKTWQSRWQLPLFLIFACNIEIILYKFYTESSDKLYGDYLWSGREIQRQGGIGRVKFQFPPPTREELKNNSSNVSLLRGRNWKITLPMSPSYEGNIGRVIFQFLPPVKG